MPVCCVFVGDGRKGKVSEVMARRCTFLGGPRDGDIVDYTHHMILIPITTPVTYAPMPTEPALIRSMAFEAKQDYDGRWWYVKQPG